MDRNRLVIGLLWHSVNSDNFGVGALTLSNIAIIRRAAARLGVDVEFVVIGWQDTRTPYVTGPDITMMPLRPREHVKRPHHLLRVLRRCDVVFDIGAGDSFADLYGTKRFFYMFITKLLVQMCGRPLVLSPQTIGPFRRWWVRFLAGFVMKRSRAVVARDHLSFDVLKAMGVRKNASEAIDVAFELPREGAAPADSGKVRVGINVSGLLYNGGADVGRKLGLAVDYADAIENVLAHFTGREECEVHLIGHVFPEDPIEDDRRAMARLAEKFPGVIVAPEFASPSAAKAYIAAMDFFTGARMHACIAAFSSGVAVVPMAYSRKFSGLFGSLGYDRVADCTKEDAATVLEKLKAGFEQRDVLRREIAAGLETARQKLAIYDSVVTASLEGALEKRPVPEGVAKAA